VALPRSNVGVAGGRSIVGSALLVLLAPLAAMSVRASAPEPRQIEAGGRQREYLLVAPQGSPAAPRPLVLVLHGHLGTAANALGGGLAPSPLSAWLDIAEREHLLLAALQGLKGTDNRTGWHDCRADDDGNPQVDDVAFASRVAQTLIADLRADPKRVYVMGMSNGAMMTQRLALEMQPRPAAVAAVAGTLAAKSSCTGTPRPVSVLLIHGTDDPLVPYDGGAVGLGENRNRGSVSSVDATRDFWLRVDGLQSAKAVAYSFPHAGDDATRARKLTYGADAGPQVVVLTIEKGGHVEPSKRFHYGALYSRIVGAQNGDLEAAEEAWAFFKDKARLD
jgi:polyhydroxybutyrate depolymerase